MSEFSIATQLVHAGERRDAPLGVPAATPIYATSTFVYERMEDVDRVVEGETSGFVYSRYGNPTVCRARSGDGGNRKRKIRVLLRFGNGGSARRVACLRIVSGCGRSRVAGFIRLVARIIADGFRRIRRKNRHGGFFRYSKSARSCERIKAARFDRRNDLESAFESFRC